MKPLQILPHKVSENTHMLADQSSDIGSGNLEDGIHLADSAKHELVEFIAQELPTWRDRSDRPAAQAETTLTGHLCDHLNGAAYRSEVWDYVQFRTEITDETVGGRTIDLAPKPKGCALIIAGIAYTEFDMLLPIECKRLPTPQNGATRDKREYVVVQGKTTGGIQRFKLGLHGAKHTFAAMIAYVQDSTCEHWHNEVNGWISDLPQIEGPLWSLADCLNGPLIHSANGLSRTNSQHSRPNGMADILVEHLWIRM